MYYYLGNLCRPSHKFALFFSLVLRFVPHDALRHVSRPSKRPPGVLFALKKLMLHKRQRIQNFNLI